MRSNSEGHTTLINHDSKVTFTPYTDPRVLRGVCSIKNSCKLRLHATSTVHLHVHVQVQTAITVLGRVP